MFQHVNAFSGFTLIEMNNSTLTTIQMTFLYPLNINFGVYIHNIGWIIITNGSFN